MAPPSLSPLLLPPPSLPLPPPQCTMDLWAAGCRLLRVCFCCGTTTTPSPTTIMTPEDSPAEDEEPMLSSDSRGLFPPLPPLLLLLLLLLQELLLLLRFPAVAPPLLRNRPLPLVPLLLFDDRMLRRGVCGMHVNKCGA